MKSELAKAATYLLAAIGSIVFITWLINWTLNWMPTMPSYSVSGDVNSAFTKGDRVIHDHSSVEIPKGAIGTIVGTPLDNDRCEKEKGGRYKVTFDAYPYGPSPDNWWCETPDNIKKVK